MAVNHMPNSQRMELTVARGRRRHERVRWSREASIPSGVEPARRRFVKAFSYADCFFRRPLASITYAYFHHFGTLSPRSAASENRAMMQGDNRAVQSNPAAGRLISRINLTPGSHILRQVRRAAAGFNKSPEPTAVGAVRSAIAVHVASRRWLSFFR